MPTIKDAADSLLKKGEITQEEYGSIDFEKIAIELKPKLLKGLARHFIKNPSLIGKPEFADVWETPELQEAYRNMAANGPNVGDIIKENIKNLWPVPVTIASAFAIKEGLVDPLVQNNRIQKSYEQLSEKVPQLAEADQDKIRDYFDVIKTYSPHSAANPLVAGALVNKMMEFGGVDHKLVQDLINIQSGKGNMEAIKTMVGGGLGTLSKPSKEN